jgi:hypothetical protein
MVSCVIRRDDRTKLAARVIVDQADVLLSDQSRPNDD